MPGPSPPFPDRDEGRHRSRDGDTFRQCPKCKAPRKATKRLTLARLPPILIVHLKRFSFKGPFSDKLETLVQYPLYGFDLTNHVPPPLPPSTANLYQVGASGGARYHASHHQQQHAPRAQVYDLYGVTNHFGSLSSGHCPSLISLSLVFEKADKDVGDRSQIPHLSVAPRIGSASATAGRARPTRPRWPCVLFLPTFGGWQC